MFKKCLRETAFLLCFMLLVCSTVLAAAADCVSFQGKLTDSSGAPIADGAYDMTFKFYDASTGGALLLTDRHLGASGAAVQVAGGIYSTLLGGGSIVAGTESSLWNVFLNHSEVYLGVTVGSDSEMTPRIPLTRTPYAVKAERAENASTLNGQAASNFLDVSSTAQVKMGKLGIYGSVPGAAMLELTNNSSNGLGIKSTVTSSDASVVAVNKGTGSIIKGISGTFGNNLVFQVAANGDTTVSGTGKVTASSFNFPAAQPKTGRLVLSPADVVPTAANDPIAINSMRIWGWQYGGGKENVLYMQSTQGYSWAGYWLPVHLPDGAKITNLIVGFNDSDNLTTSEARLSKYSLGGILAEHIAIVNSVDSNPLVETPINNYVIDNGGYSYVLGLKLYTAQSGAMTFTGAMIEYTYTDLKN